MKNKIYLLLVAGIVSLASCAKPLIRDEPVNIQASIPKDLNFSKQRFKVMSTMINKKKGTMSTLYGNDIAIRAVKAGAQQHTVGMAMALVTWKQQPSPYWYGDNIPGVILSVEILTADSKTKNLNYSLFEGKKLVYNPNTKQADQRKSFILAQKLSILP